MADYDIREHSKFLGKKIKGYTIGGEDSYLFASKANITIDGETISLNEYIARDTSKLALKCLIKIGKVCLTDPDDINGALTNNGNPFLTMRDQVVDPCTFIQYRVFIISEESELSKNVKYFDEYGNKHYVCAVTLIIPYGNRIRYLAVIPHSLLNDKGRGTLEKKKNLLDFLLSIESIV